MRKMLAVTAALVGLFALGGAAAAAETPISQAEMEAAFKGKTFNFDDGGGNKGTISYGADGSTINVKAPTGPQSPEDSGKYRFANGGYCSSWTKLRSGAEACFTATKAGSGYQLWKADGTKDDMLTPQ